MKKKCELCSELARMYCESDQASLCWSCDFKVHAANFLVERHLRTLLCHVCQSPTPWTAKGIRLGPTVSVCDHCCLRKRSHLDNGEEEVDVNESEDEDVGEQDDDEEEDDNEDNQVVPWSPTTPPPPASSSSNTGEEGESYSSSSASSSLASSSRDRKRMRKNASDPRSHENRRCINLNEPPEMSAEEVSCGAGGGERADFVDSLSTRSLKRRRRESERVGISGSNSWAIVESVKRLHRREMGSPAAIAELCRLIEDHTAVDCDSSKNS